MKIYLVSYDLGKPLRDYTGLITHIEAAGDTIRPLKSLWYVKTSMTCIELKKYLVSYIDSDDKLLVVPTAKGYTTKGLSKEHIAWMKSNLA